MDYGLKPIDFRNPAAAAGKVDVGSSRRGFVMSPVASHAGADALVKQDTTARVRGLIDQGGSGSEIVVFPNADHGFNADHVPSYDKAAASYAQKLASGWFKKYRV